MGLGVGIGVTLAVLSGLLPAGEDLLDPVVQAASARYRFLAWFVAIIWFGVREMPKIFLIGSVQRSRSI